MAERLSLHDLSARLAADIEAVCRHYLPNGSRNGQFRQVGSVAGEPGNSLRVNLAGRLRGRWKDWAHANLRGDALDLIRAARDLATIGDAALEARRFLALPAGARPRPCAVPPACRRQTIQAGLEKVLARSRSIGRDDPAGRYLASRGLAIADASAAGLRFRPDTRVRVDGEKREMPALLAPIRAVDGTLERLQRIFLTEDGRKAPMDGPKRASRRLFTGAVRWPAVAARHLVLTEGAEDALAVCRALGPARHLTTTHSWLACTDPATRPVMHAGLHQFRAETIIWFRDAVSEEGRTRSSLARDLCALEGWTGDRGEPCPGSARKALPVLARKLGLELPAAQAASGRGRRAGERKADCPDLSLRCRLAEPDTVMPEPVSGDTDRRLWEAMMATHHPQGRARAPGGQLRYRVCSSVHGRLGGIGFCAASWHRKARDDYIGWSADARAAHLSQAISNHRFLLLPGVRVHGLASQAPRQAGRIAASGTGPARAGRSCRDDAPRPAVGPLARTGPASCRTPQPGASTVPFAFRVTPATFGSPATTVIAAGKRVAPLSPHGSGPAR